VRSGILLPECGELRRCLLLANHHPRTLGVSDTQTGLLAALPFIFGGIGMVLLGQHSDRTMERKGHVAVALLMAAIGIGLSGLVSNPIIVMALLCFAQIGVSSVPAMVWPLPRAS